LFERIKEFFSKKSMYVYPYERGMPKWSLQKDKQYITEAYEKVTWVYSCVAAIGSAVGSVPWLLYDRYGKKLKEIEEHPILNLVNKQVNNDFTSSEFFELWAVYLATQGKFYAQFSNPVRYDRNLELYPMYPHLVRPIIGVGDDTLQGFYYELKSATISPNLVLWDRFIDPIDYYQGLSPIRAGARTIDTENQAVDWNKNMFDNMAVPPGALALMNAPRKAIEEAKRRWKQDYAGPKNARMPLIFDSEKINYINFGLSALDMDFLQQKKVNRVEICSIFGVPGQVVGDPENQTYANYEQALKSFWSNTVLAKYINRIEKKLNKEIVSAWGPRYFLRPDVSQIAVLQEDENMRSERVRAEFDSNLITQNEARELLGFEAVTNGNVFSFELSSMLADTLMDDEAEPDVEPEDENLENEEGAGDGDNSTNDGD